MVTRKRSSYRLDRGMPAGRKFDGKSYAYWFHADTKAEAEKLKREFTNPGVSRIRIVPKKRGYDIYGTYRDLGPLSKSPSKSRR
jgi:hypothetical protein